MSTHSFPDPIFESLLDRLARALEVTQKAESTNDPRVRQELFQTTTDFKDALNRAKEIANSLPGGELLIEEQEEVIAMLERLRDKKSEQLSFFSSQSLSATLKTVESSMKMEIDSTASSPHD